MENQAPELVQSSESEEDSEEYFSETDKEEEIIIRAKWTMDGAHTIDEAVERIRRFIARLESLRDEGWELRKPVDDDWGFLYRSK